jgi:hypothetical protein
MHGAFLTSSAITLHAFQLFEICVIDYVESPTCASKKIKAGCCVPWFIILEFCTGRLRDYSAFANPAKDQ